MSRTSIHYFCSHILSRCDAPSLTFSLVLHILFFGVVQGGGRKNTGGSEYLLCNDYFSTMRAVTDKQSSPVERAVQRVKG